MPHYETKKRGKSRKIPSAVDKMLKGVGRRKVKKVMGEYKRGILRTNAGSKPKSRKQAVAIALSEAKRLKKKK